MRKRILLSWCLVLCLFGMAGCRKKTNEETRAAAQSTTTEREGVGAAEQPAGTDAAEDEEALARESRVLGVFLSAEEGDAHWKQDVDELRGVLADAGYTAQFFYADEERSKQEQQLKAFLKQEPAPDAMVVAPVDAYSLKNVLTAASEAGTAVISYDDLIMDTESLNYLITFDMREAGKETARELISRTGLDTETPRADGEEKPEAQSIEFLLGDAENLQQLFYFNGMMEELAPFFEDGSLISRSGEVRYENLTDGRHTVEERLKELLVDHYDVVSLPDILVTADDEDAVVLADTLQELGFRASSSHWPLIVGVGGSADAVRRIASGMMEFTVFLDNRELAKTCAETLVTYLSGEEPELSNYSQYDNGVRLVRTVSAPTQIIDRENYRLLVDNGYYDERELETRP